MGSNHDGINLDQLAYDAVKITAPDTPRDTNANNVGPHGGRCRPCDA
jgi:hypothetical protein